jgi:hypothetical protein
MMEPHMIVNYNLKVFVIEVNHLGFISILILNMNILLFNTNVLIINMQIQNRLSI